MYCALVFFLGGTEAIVARFQVLRSRHVFGGSEAIGSRFHVLHSRTLFGRYRERRVPISCFAVPDSFKAIPRASSTIVKFCAPRHVFGGTLGVGTRFQVLRSGTYFFTVPMASGTIFKFCSPGLIFDGTEGVGARFHVLRSQILFGHYRGRRGSFSNFALPDKFLALPRASGLIFKLCALGHFLGGTEAVVARFQVLRSRTHFGRFRGRRGLFSSFVLPGTCLAVPGLSWLVFKF
jgi:hypothetical protein